MRITVNGRDTDIATDPPTIIALIESLGLTGRPCAVELNDRVIPRREHEATLLRDGDRIELVTLVGGG